MSAQGIAAGTRLAERYVIERRAGAGAMAEVYRALDERSQKAVAVKVLSHADDATELHRSFFRREVKALMALDEPSILRLLDHGEMADGRPFVVTEFLDGFDLEALVEARGPMPEPVVAAVGLRALLALEAAAALSIVHRDLKPSNLFLCKNGRVVVLDFGLARATAADGGTLATSLDTRVVGTPRFLAPEQLRGVTMSAQSDLYSLGATLFYLASGQHAVAAKGTLDIINTIASGKLQSLAAVAPHLSASFVETVTLLLAHAPEDRPTSAAAARARFDRVAEKLGHIDAALRNYANALPASLADATAAPQATFVATAPPKVHTRRPMVIAAIALVSVLGVAVLDLVLRGRRAPAPQALTTVEAPAPQNVAALPAPVERDPLPVPPPVAAPAPAPAAPPAARAVEPGTGRLNCDLQQWAEVFVDGKSYGVKEIAARLDLPAGKHLLEFKNPNLGKRTRSVMIKRGQETVVHVDFD
jgi:serine/threonine-protein kinase